MSLWDDYCDHDTRFFDEPRTVECKRCGVSGLVWEEVDDDEWVLLGARNEVHKCDMQRAALSDFEDIS